MLDYVAATVIGVLWDDPESKSEGAGKDDATHEPSPQYLKDCLSLLLVRFNRNLTDKTAMRHMLAFVKEDGVRVCVCVCV